MSDIAPIRAVVALGAPAAIGAASAAPTLATVAGGAIPPALAQLGIGAVISGIVAERGPRGQVVIRTDKGTLTLQTPLALRIGASVTVQIQSLGAQSQIMILSVDGQPLANQQTGTAQAKQSPSSGLPGPATTSAKTPAAPDVFVRTAAPALATPPLAPLALRAGAVLTGVLTQQTSLPSRASAPAPITPPAATPQSDGETIAVRILGIAPPMIRPAMAVPLSDIPPPRLLTEIATADDAVTFMATVLDAGANEAPGTTLLRTPFGLMRLPVPASEPPGSQIALELLAPRDDTQTRMAPLAHELGASRRLISLGQEWPALRDAVAALETDAPDLAQQTLATAVPRVGPTLAAGMLLFIAAVRSGNLRNWLGDQAVNSLERGGHGALASQLTDDVAALPRLAETQPNGWQTLLLPVFDGENLRQIRMSLRRSRKDKDGARKDGARFIVEAELSKLGPFQLDGLVRLPQFDLAVRTRDNLPPELRANIVEIFNDALQATGLKGAVVFQVARDLRPGPFEDWQASGQGLTV